jgi:nitrogen regulatory protein PII-like uncharacterized protein
MRRYAVKHTSHIITWDEIKSIKCLSLSGGNMSDTYYSAIMVGTVIEEDIVKKFEEKIKPYTTEEIIKSFIYSVVNGDLEIKR